MYLVRKHTKENDTEVVTPLFVTNEEYAKTYVKEQNKFIKLMQKTVKLFLNNNTITSEESFINIMNSDYTICDFILKKEDLYNYILIDAIEVPFYEGKFNVKTFVPNSAMMTLTIKLRENALDIQKDNENGTK